MIDIFYKARESHRFCCLSIYSDYDYCWEIRWVFANDKKHKTHRTHCHDTLEEALLEFEQLVEE